MSPITHREVIGLTGSTGSGKSAAARFFSECGAHLVSADELAREVVVPGSKQLEQIADEFGREMLKSDGTLNRKQLGARVFSDLAARRRLEAILHPAIRDRAVGRFGELRALGPEPIIYDVPLLFEAGLDSLGFRAIIVVSAPDALCLQRIVERDGISEDEARRRFSTQLPLAEKRARADFVIENDGTLEDLRRKVQELYPKLVSLGTD